MIYLDNAATTYPKPESVYRALDFANRNLAFNAGRGHYEQAEKVYQMINSTKEMLAKMVNLQPENVAFESSATEALNLIIYGIDFKRGDNVYISPFEHNAIVRPLNVIKQRIGINVHVIPFNHDSWDLELKKLSDQFILFPPKAIFVSHISNVTGFILPYEDIFSLGRLYHSINVLDCAQSMGLVRIPNFENIDFISFAGHKSLYASFGVAGFIGKDEGKLKIIKSGGTGSDSLNPNMNGVGFSKFEAGSANSVAIFSLNESLKWLKDHDVYSHEKNLTEYAIARLKAISSVKLFVPPTEKFRVGIISFAVNGYSSDDVGQILSQDYDICTRTGYHCAPLVHDFIGSKTYGGTVRISLSYFNTNSDIDALVSALGEI